MRIRRSNEIAEERTTPLRWAGAWPIRSRLGLRAFMMPTACHRTGAATRKKFDPDCTRIASLESKSELRLPLGVLNSGTEPRVAGPSAFADGSS